MPKGTPKNPRFNAKEEIAQLKKAIKGYEDSLSCVIDDCRYLVKDNAFLRQQSHEDLSRMRTLVDAFNRTRFASTEVAVTEKRDGVETEHDPEQYLEARVVNEFLGYKTATVSLGYTMNLGNYESAKVHVELQDHFAGDVCDKDLEKLYLQAAQFVAGKKRKIKGGS